MREINHIVIHCTKTSPQASVNGILDYWAKPKKEGGKGWKSTGYHILVAASGNVFNLQDIEKPSNGASGHNHDSLHIAYIGGENWQDTRTLKQKETLLKLITEAKRAYPNAEIIGHRDFEGVTKLCPAFDAKKEYKNI